MENKKFEELIDLIINEQEDKARELFHEIVVEKSREIYESIMDEEMMGEEGEMVGEVGDLMDEISAEEAGGMTEDDDEGEELEVDDEEEIFDLDSDDKDMGDEMGAGSEEPASKDDVDEIKSKLDQLIDEFEKVMGGGDNMGGEEMMEASDEDMTEAKEDDEDSLEESEEDMEEEVMEAVNLKKVGGQTYNTFGKMGDDGAQKKSPVPANSGQAGMATKPVMSKGTEAVPNGPKGPSNAYAKGEKDLPGAGNFKNVPGKDNFKEKGEAATKPHLSQATGVNTKSPVAKG